MTILGIARSTLVPALLMSPALAQTGGFDLSFQFMTDAFGRVPSGLVTAYGAHSGASLQGDAYGETATSWFSSSEMLTLIFEEVPTTTANGLFQAETIGQQLTLLPSDLAAFVDRGVVYTYFQPTARQLLFDSSADGMVSDFESGWRVVRHTDEGSDSPPDEYYFSSWVAELPTTESISRYLAFAVNSNSTLYQHGVLLRMDEDVDLGEPGFDLLINTVGYSYGIPASPVVQSLYVGDAPGGSALAVSIEGLAESTIAINVRGRLKKGDNLILLSQPDGGGRRLRARRTNGLAVLPTLGPLPGEVFCTVQPPTSAGCDWGGANDCVPDTSFSGSDSVVCPEPDCTDVFIWVGQQTCSPSCDTAGGPVTRTTTFTGSISATIRGGPVTISASGGVSGSKSKTITPPPGGCTRAYLCTTMCSVVCDVCYSFTDSGGGFYSFCGDAIATCFGSKSSENEKHCMDPTCR